MLFVGTIGAPWLGYVQDVDTNSTLKADHSAVYEETVANTQTKSFLGLIDYKSVDETNATPGEKETIATVQDASKKTVLRTATILPITMLVAYLLLMTYFNSKGGYKPIELMGGEVAEAAAEDASNEITPASDSGQAGADGDADVGGQTS